MIPDLLVSAASVELPLLLLSQLHWGLTNNVAPPQCKRSLNKEGCSAVSFNFTARIVRASLKQQSNLVIFFRVSRSLVSGIGTLTMCIKYLFRLAAATLSLDPVDAVKQRQL